MATRTDASLFILDFIPNINETQLAEKNELLRETFEKIKGEGDHYVYYLPTDELIGEDGETTVDGVHLTNTGFDRLARKVFEAVQTIEERLRNTTF